MRARKTPESWFWFQDIQPGQIGDTLVVPGAHMVQLASYGEGRGLRFASVVYKEPGPPRSWLIGLDAAALAKKLDETGARPVSITTYVDEGARRFAVVTSTGPAPITALYVGLDEAGVLARLAGHRIVDFTTYVDDGARRYAIIVEQASEPSWWVTGLEAPALDQKLIELGARLVRLRGYEDQGRRKYAAVMEKAEGGRWAWYSDLDGDGVGKKLETNNAYPVDLDPWRGARGVRFNVVMYEE